MQNNKLIEFVAQILIRFFSKTPWFWKVVQAIAGLVALALLIPQWVTAYNESGFELPDTWSETIQTIVGYTLIGQAFIAQLAVPAEVKKENNLKD